MVQNKLNIQKDKKIKFQRKRKIAAFTLIEMLIVIAIIAILSSVFLVGLSGFRQSAYDTRRVSDLQKVQTYLEGYYNGSPSHSYPAVPSGNAWSDLAATLGVSAFPDDPIAPNQHYVYCIASDDGQSYIMAAKLTKDNSNSYSGDTVGYSCTTDGGTPTCGSGSWFCVKP